MRQRVSAARVARLATVDGAGRPHVVPFCFVLDGDTIYSAVDHKPKTTTALKRLDNVRSQPHVSVLVDHYDDDDWSQLWWIRMDGTGRVLDGGSERDRALSELIDKYGQYREHVPMGPVLAIDIARWSAWGSAALG